jgi:hypothetical protein
MSVLELAGEEGAVADVSLALQQYFEDLLDTENSTE